MRKKVPKHSSAEKAFTESAKNVLGDLHLRPWTPSRIIAAQAMGMLYPHIGAEGWDQFQRTKMYPGCLKDTVIVLWLCTLKDDDVDDADAAPKDAYKAARQWAAEKGILKPDSDAFWQAYSKFADIVKQVSDSATKPKGAVIDDEDQEFPKD